VRSLAELGFADAADAFRRFIQRSAAGSADELRIMYGLGGERRIPEQELGALRGWRGIGPVRVGNGAAVQRQLDTLGELLELAWRWHCRGHAPDDDLWHFASSLVERAAEEWSEPDAGLWEWRGGPLPPGVRPRGPRRRRPAHPLGGLPRRERRAHAGDD
jgi:GH15 family glucan-1,4-alpha-glucosidase